MNIGGTIKQTLEFSEQLDILHKHISKYELPVKKSDSFDKQCILLEEYIGQSDYLICYKKMKTANYLSGLIAAPVLIAVIIFYVYAKLNRDFDIAHFIINNSIIYIVAGVLFVLTLLISLYFYLTKRKLYGTIYPSLKKSLHINGDA